MKSFSEDQYGIVQQTLPDILTTYIQLQKVNLKTFIINNLILKNTKVAWKI